DLKPAGLARILTTAQSKGRIPQIVFASAIFTKDNPKDASLKRAFADVGVKPYTVIVRDGLKIGIFGILGKDAAAVSPFAAPVKFRDPVEVSREVVTTLREKEKVDIVICLSHSGLHKDRKKSEDEILAREVKGIDVIVSGHTHALHPSPVQAGDTIIVHAWVYGKHTGVLDIAFADKKVKLKNYQTVVINSAIAGDSFIQDTIDSFKKKIDADFLGKYSLNYDKIIASTNKSLTMAVDESPVGNLIADSIRWYVNKYDANPADPESRVAVAIESNGVIRDDLLQGKTGKIAVGDLFRTIPLGIGSDDSMGYPLISFYLYGYEIKRALEILTSVQPQKGPDYFLQVSGLRFTYNPNRVIFDRVTAIELGSIEDGFHALDYSKSNKKLYRAAANIYNSAFLKVIGGYTFHFLDIVPKNKNGQAVNDLSALRVDGDKSREGIQELKQWLGTILYVQSFSDANNDGRPDIPEKYQSKQGRIVVETSWSPAALLANCSLPTYLALLIAGIALALVVIAIVIMRRKLAAAKAGK
ncbi:MAG TPA: 5'-nucleotidase C-terminal domain-containing protein, partial [Smithellaceae bacterium]|nr:5'-nucleotidase C-terminal domain-containing protein [Smithellaceae bacterium]